MFLTQSRFYILLFRVTRAFIKGFEKIVSEKQQNDDFGEKKFRLVQAENFT